MTSNARRARRARTARAQSRGWSRWHRLCPRRRRCKNEKACPKEGGFSEISGLEEMAASRRNSRGGKEWPAMQEGQEGQQRQEKQDRSRRSTRAALQPGALLDAIVNIVARIAVLTFAVVSMSCGHRTAAMVITSARAARMARKGRLVDVESGVQISRCSTPELNHANLRGGEKGTLLNSWVSMQ